MNQYIILFFCFLAPFRSEPVPTVWTRPLTFSRLVQLLVSSLDADTATELTSEIYSCQAWNISRGQRLQMDAALEDTKAANLALALAFTVVITLTAMVASFISV